MNNIALLRGAPITVFVALLKEGGTATTGRLGAITGYSQPTVTRACRQLCEAGIATDTILGWQMLDGGSQMLLGSTKNILPTTTVLNNDIDSVELTSLTEEASKNILVLKSAGVGEPMRSKLASVLDTSFIEAHIAQWRKEGRPVAMLVHRLRNRDNAPMTEEQERGKYVEGAFSDFIEH